jgi:hypothetical protein
LLQVRCLASHGSNRYNRAKNDILSNHTPSLSWKALHGPAATGNAIMEADREGGRHGIHQQTILDGNRLQIYADLGQTQPSGLVPSDQPMTAR